MDPVIDLSHHNPTPDWDKLKAAGCIGVIHKATEGTSYVDKTLFSRAKEAMAAGLKWSTYHFLRPGKITAQIDHYLATIDPVEGERIVLDHEDAGVSLTDLEKAVRYIATIRPDLQVTIYSGHLIKEQLNGNRSKELAATSLWIAQYTSAGKPSWPVETWPAWSLWQYTDKATVPGISAPVDANRWNGTSEALLSWFGPAGSEVPEPAPDPVPEPAPGRETVDIFISTPEGVPVSVTINGQLVASAAF